MTITRLLSTILMGYFGVSVLAAKSELPAVEFTPELLTETIDQRSATIRLAQLAVDEATAGIAVAENAYLPDVSASWQIGYLGNGYLTDRNFSGGTGITNPHFVNNFALEAIQTLYSGGAVTAKVRLAEIDKRMTQISLDERRQQMRFLLLSALIDLDCLYKQKTVIQNNIDLAEKLLVTMRARRDEGVALKSDISRYELQVADLQLQLDRLNERTDNLNYRISMTLDYPAGTAFSLKCEAVDDTYPMPDMLHWQQMAQTQNTSMQKARLGIEARQTGLQLANAEKMPHVGAFVYGQFNSPITIEVPVLNKNFMYWGFGLNVTYNISSLFKTDKTVSKARVSLQESQTQLQLTEQSLCDNINEAYNQWLTSCSELRTRRSSLRLAQENYDIVSERFNEGMALVTDLVDAANVRISAQTGVEIATSQLLYCIYRLKYLTNTL